MLSRFSTRLVRQSLPRLFSSSYDDEIPLKTPDKGTHKGLDPVQKVFIDQIQKYRKSSKGLDGPVDAGPEYKKNRDEEISRIARHYDIGNPTEFPKFEFKEPDLNQDETDFSIILDKE